MIYVYIYLILSISMKIKPKLILIALSICLFSVFFVRTTFVSATNACEESNIITCNEENGITFLLKLAVTIFTALVAIAAVGGIIYGAVLYTSSGGSADKTKKAREIITNTIIGIVCYALMFVVLNFLVPGGVSYLL